MRATVLAAVAAALLAAGPALAFEFKGFVIGGAVTPQRVTDELRIFCGAPASNGSVTCFGITTIATASGNISLTIDGGGKLERIVVGFSSEDFDGVFLALVDKWGSPVSMKEPTVQNRLGAKYQDLEAQWRKKGARIFARRYADSLDKSIVIYSGAAANERQKKGAAAAKDL